jgi:hypothetical protein
VVLATERKLPSILVDETTVEKIQVITGNIGVSNARACLTTGLERFLRGPGAREFGAALPLSLRPQPPVENAKRSGM